MNFTAMLCKNWGWVLSLGVLLTLVGSMAIVMPFISTLSTMLIIGSSLIALSVIEFLQILTDATWQKRILHFIMCVTSAWLGWMFLQKPVEGAVVLTFFMAGFFIASGMIRLILSLMVKSRYWSIALISGTLSILLGIFLWIEWPITGLWAIGFFVGVDLLFNGLTLIMSALHIRKQCAIK